MPVDKPVGATATFTVLVTNAAGLALPDAVVTFTDDVTTAPVVDATNAQVATVTDPNIETVTVTATVQGASGPLSATDTADFQDDTPAAITVTAS